MGNLAQDMSKTAVDRAAEDGGRVLASLHAPSSAEMRTMMGAVPSGQFTAEAESCVNVPRLLQLFEGLGANCDFGLVQRAVGIERFGLFRFAFCNADDVRRLLRTRFQKLGEPEDLWLEEVGPQREYRVKSRQCPSFSSHTERYGGRDDAEVVRSAQIEKIRFLKTQLIRDLSSEQRRLFIYRGRCDIALIREIAAQIRTYGPNRLLWVNIADDDHLPGTVECLSDGLMLGFISRFGDYEGTASVPVEEWVALCAKVYRLWRDTDPPKVPLDNLISRATAKQACRWSADSSAAAYVLEGPSPTGGAMIEHRLGMGGTAPVYRVELPIDFGGIFVLSVWIQIPEGFHGRQIGALLPGCSIISKWPADLKSRGQWQRVWVRGNVPIDAQSISCDLIAEGAEGDVFLSASWCLERGNHPTGYGFAL